MDGHKSLTRYSKIPKRPLPSQLRNYLMFRLLIPILVISQRNILPEISLMEFWRNIDIFGWHLIENVLKQSGRKNIFLSHFIESVSSQYCRDFFTHTWSKVFWCNIAELFTWLKVFGIWSNVAEKYFTWIVIKSISKRFGKQTFWEIFCLIFYRNYFDVIFQRSCFMIFHWKHLSAILQRPGIWLKLFQQYCRQIYLLIFHWKHFGAIF